MGGPGIFEILIFLITVGVVGLTGFAFFASLRKKK